MISSQKQDFRFNTQTILEMIGNTPMVEILNFKIPNGNRIFAKLEGNNPSGSLKDRITKKIFESALKSGELNPDKIIVEASSGNTGISMGMMCRLMGFKSKIFMPETKSIERRKMMGAWGAELILTDGSDPDSHIKSAEALIKDEGNRYYYLNQNGNSLNSEAHYETTGVELFDQLNGKIDAFVAGFGTGGTLMGVSRKLKEYKKNIKIVSVEPATDISKIEGLLFLEGDYTPGIYNPDLIDEHLPVVDNDAIKMTREIAKKEGIFAGISSGAVLFGAMQIAKKMKNRNIAIIFGDRGERYLSTGIFQDT